jgi:uncharacterized protein YjiS (DUF1127 family)
MEFAMFENLRKRRTPRARLELTQMDAQVLRQMGLNPDDFRDAFNGRQGSLLFTPFRHPRHD